MCICVCVCVCVCDATHETHTHTPRHHSLYEPSILIGSTPLPLPPGPDPGPAPVRAPVHYHPVSGSEGLISSQFHPVGPFISRPWLIHQWPKARQEKPSEEREVDFFFSLPPPFDVWGEKNKIIIKVSRRARERLAGCFSLIPPAPPSMKKYIIKVDPKVSQWSCKIECRLPFFFSPPPLKPLVLAASCHQPPPPIFPSSFQSDRKDTVSDHSRSNTEGLGGGGAWGGWGRDQWYIHT